MPSCHEDKPILILTDSKMQMHSYVLVKTRI
jgi:hypothetical protein